MVMVHVLNAWWRTYLSNRNLVWFNNWKNKLDPKTCTDFLRCAFLELKLNKIEKLTHKKINNKKK